MSAPARVVLGADTVSRKWWLDINTGTHAAPVWTPVSGVSNFKFTEVKTFQDDSDYDSGGAKAQAATAYSWSIECTLQRKVQISDPTSYDVGQEAIRAACKRTTGIANVVECRWYEMNVDDDGDVVGPTAEAYQGYLVSQWGENGGAMDALDTVAVSMPGRGAYADITHPEATPAVPILYSVSPAVGVTAGGTLHKLIGKGFFKNGVNDIVASTGIKVGGSSGTAATGWIAESDNVAYFIAPAITSGTKAVVVYNSVGISTVTVNLVIS